LNLERDFTGSLLRISVMIALGRLAENSENIVQMMVDAKLAKLIFCYWHVVGLVAC